MDTKTPPTDETEGGGESANCADDLDPQTAPDPPESQAPLCDFGEIVDPRRGGWRAALRRDGPPGGSGPLVSYPYGDAPGANSAPHGSISGPSIAVYPDGIRISAGHVPQDQPSWLEDCTRGKIAGFSAKAAGRMREFCMTHWVSGFVPYAVTLTTRGAPDPDEWRRIMMRFRKRLRRSRPKWAWLWRVELQKREVPHLHCVLWAPYAPSGIIWREVRKMWLAATGESEDVHSQRHAVCVREVEGGESSGWLVYCALHDSKKDGAQLGWIGKQWGLWNRDAWEERPPVTAGECPPELRAWINRRLRRWSRCRFMRRDRRGFRRGELARPWGLRRTDVGMVRMVPEAVTSQLLRGLPGVEMQGGPSRVSFASWSAARDG